MSLTRTSAVSRHGTPVRIAALLGYLLLAGCQKPDVKVLIGATSIAAPGARPIDDSVIVIAGRNIRAIGMRRDVPVPQDSERTDLSGKWIVPTDGGTISAGEPARLLVLDHPPTGITPASPKDAVKRLVDGVWQ